LGPENAKKLVQSLRTTQKADETRTTNNLRGKKKKPDGRLKQRSGNQSHQFMALASRDFNVLSPTSFVFFIGIEKKESSRVFLHI
jgi:hypothetical protein